MTERDYSQGEADRRLANLVRIGTIKEIDTAKALVRVDLGENVTGWIPWTTPRAGQDRQWTTPDIGEQVVVASPSGELSDGAVIGSLFQNAYPQNGSQGKDRRTTYADGTVIEYDREASVLRATVNPAGSIILNIGGTSLILQNGQATLVADDVLVQSPQATFTGNVKVKGQLEFENGLSGAKGSGANSITGGLVLNGINQETHGHIEQGDGNRVSNPVA